MNLLVKMLVILVAIAFVVLTWYVTIYVLAMLGIQVPQQILNVIFIIIALVTAIAVLTGKFDNAFNWNRP
jgi:hypothetical protein